MREPSEGRSVIDGELRRTSVSAVKTFDPRSVGGCKRSWHFQKVVGLEKPPTKAQEIGTALHAEIESYLKTGTGLTSAIVAPGRHLIPEPGQDLQIEESLAKCGLEAAGVPFVGYIDVKHSRGTYLDDRGGLQTDTPGTVEVIDWKTSSDIWKYAKTQRELMYDVQMIGYGKAQVNADPGLKLVRLSHVYFGTKKREAAKVTALCTIDHINTVWENEVVPVVLEMKDVARETDPKKVEANLKSCNVYGGCPFKSVCLDSPVKGESAMSDLLARLQAQQKEKAPVGRVDEVTQPRIELASILPPDAPPPVVSEPVVKKAKKESSVTKIETKLFVDCIPLGIEYEMLDGYVRNLTKTAEETFKTPDIRFVTDKNSPLAFGQWKGVLAAAVRATPPPAGSYAALTTGSEFTQIVVEALIPTLPAGAVVRGVR